MQIYKPYQLEDSDTHGIRLERGLEQYISEEWWRKKWVKNIYTPYSIIKTQYCGAIDYNLT